MILPIAPIGERGNGPDYETRFRQSISGDGAALAALSASAQRPPPDIGNLRAEKDIVFGKDGDTQLLSTRIVRRRA